MPGDDVRDGPAYILEHRPGSLELELVVEERLDEQQRHRPAHDPDRVRHRLRVRDRRVLRQDHRLERTSLRRRLEPPLLVERAARHLVGVERLLLASGAVEREHQEAAEPLALGVL